MLHSFGELAGIDMPESVDIHGNPSMNGAAALVLLNRSGEA